MNIVGICPFVLVSYMRLLQVIDLSCVMHLRKPYRQRVINVEHRLGFCLTEIRFKCIQVFTKFFDQPKRSLST